MANTFSSMEYPHWLILAGAVLLVLGFIGLALRQRKGAEAKLKEANGNEQGRSESEAELAQTQAANRKAKLAEQTRQRWANKDRGTKEEPLNDRQKLSDKEPK
jgi:flagellar biosynthesis/type III secretory pathway M-ring protein FliF/YscJ